MLTQPGSRAVLTVGVVLVDAIPLIQHAELGVRVVLPVLHPRHVFVVRVCVARGLRAELRAPWNMPRLKLHMCI